MTKLEATVVLSNLASKSKDGAELEAFRIANKALLRAIIHKHRNKISRKERKDKEGKAQKQ